MTQSDEWCDERMRELDELAHRPIQRTGRPKDGAAARCARMDELARQMRERYGKRGQGGNHEANR